MLSYNILNNIQKKHVFWGDEEKWLSAIKPRGTGKKPKTPSPMTTRVVLLFVVLVIVPFFIMAAFVVRIFRDYNITTLGTSAMDSMSSVGYQISGGLKSRMESSLFAYYNDVCGAAVRGRADGK